MREKVVLTAITALEMLLVLHWFLPPGNAVLAVIALVAGIVMSLMAGLTLILLLHVLNKDPGDPRQRQELRDLGVLERSWLMLTGVQIVFTVTAFAAGVYWFGIAMVIGEGSEIASVISAHIRGREPLPEGAA